MKDSEFVFDFRRTIEEGSDHHAARFARMRECKFKRKYVDGRMVPEIDGKELSEFTVTTQRYGGVQWWHVYRRMNNGNVRFLHRFPFGGEAAAFIDDLQHGRERVFVGNIPFTKKPIKKPGV